MTRVNELRKITYPFGAFKKNTLGINSTAQDELKQHYLLGAWGDGTLKSYNSGVVKLYRFAKVKGIEKKKLLPILPELVKHFVAWASKKEVENTKEDESVKSTTLKAYIAGIKVWHMFHDEDYTHHIDDAVKTLLRATRISEEKAGDRTSDVNSGAGGILGNGSTRRTNIR